MMEAFSNYLRPCEDNKSNFEDAVSALGFFLRTADLESFGCCIAVKSILFGNINSRWLTTKSVYLHLLIATFSKTLFSTQKKENPFFFPHVTRTANRKKRNAYTRTSKIISS